MKTNIYLVQNIDGDLNKVYVGKSKVCNMREKHHRIKFGHNIIFNIIDEIDSIERKDWEALERFWIEQFRQWGFVLMNKNSGGGGVETHSEETKLLMSQNRTGKSTRVNYRHSEEAKRLISEAGRNRFVSEETRMKMSRIRLGKPREKQQCDYCGKIGGVGSMTLWHFDNCKYNKDK